MEYRYYLEISAKNNDDAEKINAIMGKTMATISNRVWRYEIVEKEGDTYIPFLDIFTQLITEKKEALRQIGVSSDDITVWFLYEYDQECNMEFSAVDLKKLTDLGIDLCISCWRKQ